MAGHSKWANIQHRKKAQDAKRGKLFTRLIRDITVSARLGDANPDNNPRLRLAIDKAIAANMSKDNVERAIKRGSGEMDGAIYENITYEGYGPGGAAVLTECTTDNKNRTVAEIRHAFTRYGGNLGTSGSVSYLFEQKGVLHYPLESNENTLLEAAITAGAKDLVSNDTFEVIVEPDKLFSVKRAMQTAGLEAESTEIEMRPTNLIPLNKNDSTKLMHLLEALDACDDVQNVYCNAEFPETLLSGE